MNDYNFSQMARSRDTALEYPYENEPEELDIPFVESYEETRTVYDCPNDDCEFYGEQHEYKRSEDYPDCYFVLICPECGTEFEIEV